jgi:HK97 family phage portal protein
MRWNLPYGAGIPSGQDATMWWWGSDQFARPLSPAQGLSAVHRATALVTGTIGSLPWRCLSGGLSPRTSSTELPTPRWISDPQLMRPDDRFSGAGIPAALKQTGSVFWSGWIRSALWKGMGYLLFEVSTDSGEPIAGTLRVLNPDLVSAHVEDGIVVRRIGSERNGGTIDTDPDGFMLIGGRLYKLLELSNPFTPADEYGISKGVFEVCAAELGMAAQAVDYGSGMYRSGIPSGYLKTTTPNFSKPQADALREQWLVNHGGDRRSIAVLNSTTDFVPITMSPVDMALVQMTQMSLVMISNMFCVPAWFLNYDGSSSNSYSNNQDRNGDLQRSLLPWAVAVEETLSSLLATQRWIEVDFRGLLRPDVSTRYAAYSTALRDRWMTVAEVRSIENLPPLPEQGYPGENPALGATEPADA